MVVMLERMHGGLGVQGPIQEQEQSHKADSADLLIANALGRMYVHRVKYPLETLLCILKRFEMGVNS